MRRHLVTQGFTLIELMIAVSIVGVLSAIAVPTFAMLVRRSKTAEVPGNLDALFKGAAAYYASERAEQGNLAKTSGHCTVDDGGPEPANPGREKQVLTNQYPALRALGFMVGDPLYFAYGVWTRDGGGICGNQPNTVPIYTFYAWGDLDGDGERSAFELTAMSNASNMLQHAQALSVVRELE